MSRMGRSLSMLLSGVLAVTACGDADSGGNDAAVADETSTSSTSSSSTTSTTDPVGAEIDSGASDLVVADEPSAPSTSSSSTTTTTDSAGADAARFEVSVSIECRRGESLSGLGIDIGRVPFVADDAPDDTRWVEITATAVNPTDTRVQIDPGFEVTFADAAGAELVTQPFVGDSDPIFRDISATEFVVGPNQTVTQRFVIFEGFSGRLFLRDSHDLLLESLGDCAISGEPAVEALDSYEAPANVTLDLSDCEPTEDGALFEAILTVNNDGAEAVELNVAAEILDEAGNRIARIGTNEQPVAAAPGETETRTLGGSAWTVEDLSSVAGCGVYFAEPAAR